MGDFPAAVTVPGDSAKANEDWVFADENLIVVLDGGTARTDTGCRHGVAWYAAKLGSLIAFLATDQAAELAAVLRLAIAATADQHRECDLTHAATPSAALAIVRRAGDTMEYLVLGDVTVVLDKAEGLEVVTDGRVDRVARQERLEAARLPIGSEAKAAALLRMKHAELAARNREDGFWVAAADPAVAGHAITATVPLASVRRVAVLTDGAARAVVLFGLLDWAGLLNVLAQQGPAELITQVRTAELGDPKGLGWARNKRSDDATAVFSLVG